MTVKVEIGHYYFKILIDELPHVCIDASDFKGFHSWRDSDTQCCIEFITRTNKIKVEYDSVEKWKTMLKALNEKL